MLGEGLRAGLSHMGCTHRTIAYIEREAYAASVLVARMEEGSLDPAPIWPDLLTFDGRRFRGVVDCIAAGFPCQDLSLAGKRAGLDGARSGLFFDILDIADACGARNLFLENVAGIASATASVVDEVEGALDERAAARVLGELADRGWNAEWLTISASDVGASHGRSRWFCFAWRMGHPGLQHLDLQQREDGAEHPGAGQPMAHSERAQRGPQCVGGIGFIQGHDTGGREAHGGSGVADEVLGHADQQRQQQPDHSDSTQPWGNTWSCACGTSCELAHAGCECHRANESQPVQGRSHTPNDCAGSGPMAHTSSPRQQGHELGRACDGNRGGQEAHGSTSQLCGLFAPGPADPEWAGILTSNPELAPALEPAFRSVVNGLAFHMDDCRAARLKCVGNGVVALQAAAAFVVLARRAGFMRNKAVALAEYAQTAIKNIAEKAAA